MGKRKERRQQAALAAVSRRVKLDLWSEEEEDHHPPLPPPHHQDDSAPPASQDQQGSLQENPLSLLGQYSDDEVEEVANELGVLSEENAGEGPHISSGSHQDEQVENFLANLETTSVVENENVIVRDAEKETTVLDQPIMTVDDMPAAVPGKIEQTSEVEWQAVLHEESGEYYFWNVRTGETTWEKPALCAQVPTDVLSTEKGFGDKSRKVVSEVDHVVLDRDNCVIAKDSNIEADLDNGTNLPSVTLDQCNLKEPTEVANVTSLEQVSEIASSGDAAAFFHEELELHGQYLEGGACNQDVQSSQAKFIFSAPYTHENAVSAGFNVVEQAEQGKMQEEYPPEPPVPGLSFPEQAPVDNSFVDRGKPYEDLQIVAKEELVTASEGFVRKSDDFQMNQHHEKVIKFGENVVQRFKILAGDASQVVPQCVRLAIEAEATVSICHALLSSGILPDFFWLHMEGELKRLESVLAVQEVSIVAEPEQHMLAECMTDNGSKIFPNKEEILDGLKQHEHETPQVTFCQSESIAIAAVCCESEMAVPAISCQTESIAVLASCQSDSTALATTEWTAVASLCHPESNAVDSSGNCCTHEQGEILESDPKETETYPLPGQVNVTSANELGIKKEQLATEDVLNDEIPDVDMEVDDELSSETIVPGMGAASEQAAVSEFYALPFPSVGFVVPEVSVQPSTLMPPESSAPALLGPPIPHVIVSDPWAPPPPPLDDEWAPPPPDDSESIPPPPPEEPPPLPPPFPEENKLTASAPPVSSYPNYQMSEYGSDYLTVPVYSTAGESNFYSMTAVDGNLGTVLYPEELMANSYSEFPHSVETTTGMQAYDFPRISAAAFTHLPATTVTFEMSALAEMSESAATTALVSTEGSTLDVEAKKSAKGKVIKRRSQSVAVAPMLRINKLSNLVSKWKQAKEELHGTKNDEEEDTMYDVDALERKRQKEIEEWRRQQLASGEAFSNANFQPLGVIDWRERVKRARIAETSGSGMPSQPEVAMSSEVSLQGKKPDLDGLSKGLPFGWQAFWDESSGDIYYGNVSTQETTWERPGT